MWRDTAKGLVNGLQPQDQEPLGDPVDDSSSESEPEQVEDRVATARSTSPATSRSNSVPTRPPSSASSRQSSAPPDDDFDIDAMIREEEERQTAQAVSSLPTQQKSRSEIRPVSLPDEDQDMWDQLDGGFGEELTSQSSRPPPQISSTGDEMEDQDMWDLVREMESTASNANVPVPLPAAPSSDRAGGSSIGPNADNSKKQPPATNDEGWDEMYL
jgi:replication fork protection complex subunit Csm3/Swi3